MTGKLIACILSLFTFFFIFLISITFYIDICVNERVNDICYDIAETISVKGIVTDEMISYLDENIEIYGDFEIGIQAEITTKTGNRIFLNGIDQIRNKELSIGDRIYITVINKYPTFFEKFSGGNYGISVVKVAIIN